MTVVISLEVIRKNYSNKHASAVIINRQSEQESWKSWFADVWVAIFADMNMWKILTYLTLFVVINAEDANLYRTVETKNGLIRGIKLKTLLKSREYFAFKGIPYAEKPIGELRFKVSRLTFPFWIIAINWFRKCSRQNRSLHGNQIHWMHWNTRKYAISKCIFLLLPHRKVKIAYF